MMTLRRYVGEWKNGSMHTEGRNARLEASDGSMYEGQFCEGLRHGQGSHEYAGVTSFRDICVL